MVPDLVRKLLAWINAEETQELDPVIELGIAHYELVRIHPSAKGQVALSDRQMNIVEHLNRYQFITVGDMVKMFQITRQAALNEVGKLVELEVVHLVGQKRSSRYILT